MCQIIALHSKNVEELSKTIEDYERDFYWSLKSKGGDYYSAVLVAEKRNEPSVNLSWSAPNYDDFIKALRLFLKANNFKEAGKIALIMFSRQQPEMEAGDPEEQPYKIDNGFIAIHGTIINDQELAAARDVSINIDTEIFKYYEINDPVIQGTFSCIQITDKAEIIIRDNGLKIWEANVKEHQTTVVSTGKLDYLLSSNPIDSRYCDSSRTLMAAFSGGMDISLSLYKQLHHYNYKKIILNYFDWGSNASKNEKEAIEKLRDFYSTEFKIPIELNILPAKEYFKAFFEITDTESKISNIDAKGDHAETESPIAYVPYRNSQFALLLSSIAEAKDYRNVDILFGLNLSEGMVFMDNSEGWLESITNVIKYGGKDYSVTGNYKIVAPYFPRTKTNMIKEFVDEFGKQKLYRILMKSWSCYYPEEDGSPCGECGSCILRQEAILRAIGD